MMKLKICILLTLAALTACSGDAPGNPSGDDAVVGSPVIFTSGNENLSRAIPYLGEKGRFVCRMYHQGTIGSDLFTSYSTAWLRVNNAYGNSVYRRSNFVESAMNLDTYDFDRNSTIFYWQNRKNHAFIAYTDLHRCFKDDYNEATGLNMTTDFTLTESETDFAGRKFTLTTSPTPIASLSESEKQTGDPAYYNQPDPAIANTVMLPAGATQEANRVDLIFRHCFSQIQVNLKKAADGGINDLNAADITKVELLGVSQEGYIFFDADPATGNNHDATYKKVVQSDFSTEELAANEFGTSMEMYDMGSDNYATGYVKSYRAIAFGQLGAIRITWKEDSGVEHIVTHKVVNLDSNDFINLRSGVRYIHNLELRRGTLAVIKTVILPWEIDEQQWNTSGIITEN